MDTTPPLAKRAPEKYAVEVSCPLCALRHVCANGEDPEQVFRAHLEGEVHGLDALWGYIIDHAEWQRSLRLVYEERTDPVR